MSQRTVSTLAAQDRMRREILAKSDLIPPLPDLVVKLLGAVNEPTTEPEHLERLLQNDPVLVAKMLALVNSPFYGMNRAILTIKDAVMVLGFRGVRSLVLATSAAKLLQRDFSCYGHEPRGLWLHSACVAAGAKAIARRCRLGEEAAEQLFVAGLLHDLGKLVLLPYLGNRALDGRGDLAAVERSRLGIDHTEAGALAAAKWNLSLELQAAIKGHHEAPEVGGAIGAVVVRVANVVAHELGIGYQPGRAPVDAVQAADLQVLGIVPEAWTVVRDELAALMDEAAVALNALAG
jgi:putative nucleotidyltransferase with HDIG domain